MAPGAGDFSHCTLCGKSIDLTGLLAYVGSRRIAKEALALGGTPPQHPQVSHALFFPQAQADPI